MVFAAHGLFGTSCITGLTVQSTVGVLTEREVKGREDMPAAALALQEMGWELNVVATGGHLNPPDDLLAPAEGEMSWLAGEQVVSRSTHGTGCAFSSALLSRLVWGD